MNESRDVMSGKSLWKSVFLGVSRSPWRPRMSSSPSHSFRIFWNISRTSSLVRQPPPWPWELPYCCQNPAM